MKKFLLTALVILSLLSFVTPVQAFGEPPANLAGTITIVAKNATTVTLHAEQTGGASVRLILEQYCYNYTENAYSLQKIGFTGSVDVVFNIGTQTYKGKTFLPEECSAQLWYYYSSSRGMYLAGVTILP